MTIFLAAVVLFYISFLIFNKKLDLLNPSIIFSLLILGTYFIAHLRLSLLQNVYPIWFTALIFGMLVMFYLGDKTASIIKKIPNKTEVSYFPTTMNVVIFLLWLAIIVSFLMMVLLLGAPPAISKANRAEYFVSGWGTIVVLQSTFFGLLLYDRFNKNSTKWMFWIYSLSILLIALLLSNKFQFTYMLVLYLVAYNSYKKQIKIDTLVKTGGVALLMFVLLYKFVYEQMYGVSLQAMQEGYRMILPPNLNFLIQPYLYVAFNYENLYNFLLHDTHALYGLKTFGSIIEIFHLDDIFSRRMLLVDEWKNLLQVSSMTTGTMFQDFAQDGKIWGMFVLTYLSGMWSGICYRLFKENKSFTYFFLYSATTAAIFVSFFSNAFTSKVTLINIGASVLIGLLLKVNLVWRK